MPLSNAERQARWRQRREQRLARIDDDWGLLKKAVSFPLKSLALEGKKSMATISPANVSIQTHRLNQIIEKWPTLTNANKAKLTKGLTTLLQDGGDD
jgi:hypothetical protein